MKRDKRGRFVKSKSKRGGKSTRKPKRKTSGLTKADKKIIGRNNRARAIASRTKLYHHGIGIETNKTMRQNKIKELKKLGLSISQIKDLEYLFRMAENPKTYSSKSRGGVRRLEP